MSEILDDTRSLLVEGYLFKPSGKWAYTVVLDYTGILTVQGRPADGSTYLCPNEAAIRALRQATERGISGVTVTSTDDYFTLVVPDPPNGFPVMVLPAAKEDS